MANGESDIIKSISLTEIINYLCWAKMNYLTVVLWDFTVGV